DRDLPLTTVFFGALALVTLIWLCLGLDPQTGGGTMAAIFNRTNLAATLLLTCLIFLALGWTEPRYRLLALSVAAVVCIASSNGGTTSQDLKTGYLVGGTPKWQQWAILVGSLSSALVIGYILVVLNAASTVVTTKNLPVLSEPLDASK